jgi:type II secretory pathway pseudopilin PulG
MESHHSKRFKRARAGFTLVEMMMAILLTMMVFAITIPFFRNQTLAVDKSAGRLDALQNARFAQNAIDRELRMAGGATGQPIIVQAAPFSITFNVDLVTRFATDPDATYLNPQADSLAVESWEPTRSKKLPTSTTVYPTVYYYDANGNQSPAETSTRSTGASTTATARWCRTISGSRPTRRTSSIITSRALPVR